MTELYEFYKKNPNISETDFDLGLEATSDGLAISDYVKAEQAVQEIRSTFGDDVNSRQEFQAVLSEVHPYLSEGEVNELSEKFAIIAETDMASVQDNVVVDEAPKQVLDEIKAGVAAQFDGPPDEFTAFEPIIVNLADHDLNSEGRDAIKFRDAILDLNKDLATGELESVTAQRSQVVIDESIRNHGDVLLAASEQYPDFVASQIEADAAYIAQAPVDLETDADFIVATEKHSKFEALLNNYTSEQSQASIQTTPEWDSFAGNEYSLAEAMVKLDIGRLSGSLGEAEIKQADRILQANFELHGDGMRKAVIEEEGIAEAMLNDSMASDSDIEYWREQQSNEKILRNQLLSLQDRISETYQTSMDIDEPSEHVQAITKTTPQEVGQAIAEFTRGGFQHIDDVSENTIFSKVASLEQENTELQRGDNFESVQKNTTAVEQLLVIAALEGSEDARAVNALNSVNYDMNLLAETPVPTQSYWSVEDQDDIHVGSDRERHLQSILDAVTEKRELETVLADRYNEALEEPNPDLQSKEIAKLTLDLDELRQEQRMDDYWEKRQAVEHDYGMEQ